MNFDQIYDCALNFDPLSLKEDVLFSDNILNIQPSWLNNGNEADHVSLYIGVNNLGSIMIDANFVFLSGASFKLSAYDMQRTIATAGFQPQLETQNFTFADLPSVVKI